MKTVILNRERGFGLPPRDLSRQSNLLHFKTEAQFNIHRDNLIKAYDELLKMLTFCLLHLPQKPLAGLHLKLNLVWLQHSVDPLETQHLIAGQLLFGYGHYLLDLVLPIGDLEA